ncbi:Target of rapamycin complex 1 subunit kog1, partial [Spiromyces aspiralis]
SPRINLKLRRDNSYDDNLGESDSYYSDSSYNESEDEETVGGYQYVRSDYFEDQLRAFDVWLQHAWMIVLSHSDTADGKSRVPRGELPTGLEFPVALPAVLQVILNVRYRHQALMLFYQFISLGPWAVDLAMAVGIIRYIVRLLQSNSREIRDVLIMICARMVAVDPTFRQNLEKENINYFILYLFESLDKRAGAARKEPAGDSVTEKLSLTVCSACAFILTIYCHNNPTAQEQCFEKAMQFPNQKTIGLVDCLLEHLSVYESDIPERMHFDIWIMLCLAQLWSTSPRVKWYVLNKQLSQQASQDGAGSDDSVTLTAANEPGDVLSLLALMSVRHDPRIRATAVYAIGTLLSGLLELGQDLRMAEKVHYARSVLYTCLVRATNDGSPMVRQELVYAIARAVAAERTLEFVQAIALLAEGDFGGPKGTLTAGGMAMARHAAGVTTNDSLFGTIIELTKTLLILSSDPQPDIGRDAERILDVLFRAYLHSTLYFRQAVVLRRVYSEYAQSKANAKKKSDSNGGGDGNGSPESQGRRAGALHQMLMDRVLGLSSDDINLHRQSHPSHRRGEGRDRGESASALHYSSSSADLLAKSSPKSAGEPGMHRTNSLTSESRRDYMARSLSDRPHSSLRNRPASLIGLNEVRFRRGVDSGDDGHSNGNDDEGVMTDTVASDSDAPLQFQLPANLDLQDQTVRARLAEVEQAWVRWAHGELATRLCQSYIIDWMGAQYAEANKHASDTVVSNNEAVRRGERERQVKRVTEDCNAMSNLSTHMRWGGTSTLRTKMLAVTIVHHPFMPHLIVADKKGSIHTYNWETNRSLGSFVPDPDKSSPLVRVEKLHLINPRHEPLLMVGSSDGVVRVFRSYMGDSNDNRAEDHLTTGKQAGGSPPPPSLMTALRVVPQKLASASHALSHVKSPTSATSALDLQRKLAKRNSRQQHVVTTLDRLTQAKAEVAKSAKDEDSGIRSNWKAPEIVTEWNQMSGYIYAGGRDNTIQIWDINSERHVRELITQTFEGLSCLSSDQHSGNILVVGGCSGRVRVLDCRVPDRSHFVQTWRVRPGSVINCFIRPEMMKVITASNSGVITTTDLRSKEKALSIEYMQADQGLDHFDIHPQINVMASASTHLLKLWNMQPKLIGEVNSPPVQTWSRGQLSQGKADITGAAFHPYLPIVTMSMNDGGIMNVSP